MLNLHGDVTQTDRPLLCACPIDEDCVNPVVWVTKTEQNMAGLNLKLEPIQTALSWWWSRQGHESHTSWYRFTKVANLMRAIRQRGSYKEHTSSIVAYTLVSDASDMWQGNRTFHRDLGSPWSTELSHLLCLYPRRSWGGQIPSGIAFTLDLDLE